MSQTAKHFTLLEQEYKDFIQELMTQTVAVPIASLRGSAVEALAAPAGDLVRAKEDLVRAAKELDERLAPKLSRAVDSLESVTEELDGLGSRLDDLDEERSERRELARQISASLTQLQSEITTGTENLARARDLVDRIAELQTALEDRWPALEQALTERWTSHAESQGHALDGLRLTTEEGFRAVGARLGELPVSLQQEVLASGNRLVEQWQLDFATQAQVWVEAVERFDQSLVGLHRQWSERLDRQESSGTERHLEFSRQVSSGFERMESSLKDLIRASDTLLIEQWQMDFATQAHVRMEAAERLDQSLAGLHRQWSERLDRQESSGTERHLEFSRQVGSGFERTESSLKDLVRTTEESLSRRIDADSKQRVQSFAEMAERLAALDAAQDRVAQQLDGRLQGLDSAAAQQAWELEKKLAALQKQLKQWESDSTASILSGLAHESGIAQASRQEQATELSRTSMRLDILERKLEEKLATQTLSAEMHQQELASRLQQLLSLGQAVGDNTGKKLRELENSLTISKRFLLAIVLLCCAALLANFIHMIL